MKEFHAESVAELQALSSEQLRAFESKHYDLLELPPRDGRLVPKDVEAAYLAGAASDVEFVVGLAADDLSRWQAMLAGDVSLNDMVDMYYAWFADSIGADKADKLDAALQKYAQSGLSAVDAKKALLADFQYKSCILHDCRTLAKGGSVVHCFYWNVKGNIEKLSANTVSLVTTILGNAKTGEQMGYLNDESLTEIMQALVGKFTRGKPLEFYNNELKGVREIVWKTFDIGNNRVLEIQKDSVKMSKNAFSEEIFTLERLVFDE